jgi:hypothetical protein
MGKRGGAAKLLARLLATVEVSGCFHRGMAFRKNYSLCNKGEDKRASLLHDRAFPV